MDRQRGRRHCLAHRPRRRNRGGERSRSAARRRRSRSAAARCGWPTATVERSRRSTRAPTRSSSGHDGRQRATRAGRHRRRGVGRVGSRRPHPAASISRAGRLGPSIPVGANPSPRWRRAPARCGWRARSRARSPAIEPRTGSVLPPIRVGNGPSALAVGEGAVWVVNRHDGTLSRIDPCDERVSWTVRGRQRPDGSGGRRGRGLGGGRRGGHGRSCGPGRTARGRQGSRPGAARRRSRSPADRCGRPRTPRSPRIAVGRCARSRAARSMRAPFPMDWLHPTRRTSTGRSSSSLAYDGLVAYRRVEGPAGATLVGALATNGAGAERRLGKTYVFTLRSRAALLRRDAGPADRRQGLDGTGLQATRACLRGRSCRPSSRASSAPVPACGSRAPCDLSRGIETNVPARTITIHLVRPDADFLHKLAMTFAYVVPAGSARRISTTGQTPPGTGPYRVATWDARGAAGRSFATGTSGPPRRARSAPASPTGSRSACTT